MNVVVVMMIIRREKLSWGWFNRCGDSEYEIFDKEWLGWKSWENKKRSWMCMFIEKDIYRSYVVYILNKMVEIFKESFLLEFVLDYNFEMEKIIMNDLFFCFGVRW